MANDYTTTTDTFSQMVESGYGSSVDPAYSTAMAGFITVASRLIDAECGRWEGFFYPTTDTKTFYYDGSGESEQPIDEFASITSVSVSEQGSLSSSDYTAWTENTDYLILPYNATNIAKPINRLKLVFFNGTKGAFYSGQKSVQVVGVPGYSVSPNSLVVQACKMQSVRWFMRAKQGYQDTGASIDLGGMTFSKKLELDPDIRQLLWPLKLELDR